MSTLTRGPETWPWDPVGWWRSLHDSGQEYLLQNKQEKICRPTTTITSVTKNIEVLTHKMRTCSFINKIFLQYNKMLNNFNCMPRENNEKKTTKIKADDGL